MVKRNVPYGLLFLLKLGLTLGCLWWAFSKVDLHGSVFARQEALHAGWLLGAVALGGVAVFFASLRWWLMVRAQEIPAELGRIIRHTLVGNLFGLISLGGFGNGAVRVMLLLRDHPGNKLRVTTSLLVDQLASLVGHILVVFRVHPGLCGGVGGAPGCWSGACCISPGVISVVAWRVWWSCLSLPVLLSAPGSMPEETERYGK